MRLVAGDARKFLARQCPSAAFDRVLFLFPDPWHGADRSLRSSLSACGSGAGRSGGSGSGGAGGSVDASVCLGAGDGSGAGNAAGEAAPASAGGDGPAGAGGKSAPRKGRQGKPFVDRRVFSLELARELARVCRVGARLYVATDVAAYTEHVLRTCASFCADDVVEGKRLAWVLCSINRSSAPKGEDGNGSVEGRDLTDAWHAGEPRDFEEQRAVRVKVTLREACSSAVQTAGREAGGVGVGDESHAAASAAAVAAAAAAAPATPAVGTPAAPALSLQRPGWRPLTQYERRAVDEGRFVWDLCFSLTLIQ